MTSASVVPCRLCGGPSSPAFEATVLDRYKVMYFVCGACKSLQSEDPYWLGDAYDSAIAATDTGAVTRNLICHAAIVAVARVLRIHGRFLDFGGGAGMLCRLLRDSGIDAYVCDRYSDPQYAKAFVMELPQVLDGQLALLSAIEVFEHCAEPAVEIGQLFAKHPRILFATTLPYRGEGRDWWYLGAHAGQHVFFYSPAALANLGAKHGYHYFASGYFHVFSLRPITSWQRAALRLLLSRLGLRIIRVYLAATQRGSYSDADFRMLCAQLPQEHRAEK